MDTERRSFNTTFFFFFFFALCTRVINNVQLCLCATLTQFDAILSFFNHFGMSPLQVLAPFASFLTSWEAVRMEAGRIRPFTKVVDVYC